MNAYRFILFGTSQVLRSWRDLPKIPASTGCILRWANHSPSCLPSAFFKLLVLWFSNILHTHWKYVNMFSIPRVIFPCYGWHLLNHKIFSFDEINLPIIFFVVCAFGVLRKCYLNRSYTDPLLYSRVFIVLILTFKESIHFNFYVWYELGPQIYYLHFDIQLFWEPYTINSALNFIGSHVKN